MDNAHINFIKKIQIIIGIYSLVSFVERIIYFYLSQNRLHYNMIYIISNILVYALTISLPIILILSLIKIKPINNHNQNKKIFNLLLMCTILTCIELLFLILIHFFKIESSLIYELYYDFDIFRFAKPILLGYLFFALKPLVDNRTNSNNSFILNITAKKTVLMILGTIAIVSSIFCIYLVYLQMTFSYSYYSTALTYLSVLSAIMLSSFIILISNTRSTQVNITENSMFESKHKLKSNGELFDGFRKVEDEMTGNITYRHPKAPDGYNFYQLGLWMYVHFVSSSDSSFIPYLEIRYIYRGINSSDSFQQALWGDANWIFIDSIIFKTEKNRYNLDIKPKRDNNVLRDGNKSFSYFVELDVIPLGTIPYTKMFEDIAQSPVLKIRLCGKNKNVDLDLSNYKQRKYIVDAYNAYKKAKEIHPEKIKNPIS